MIRKCFTRLFAIVLLISTCIVSKAQETTSDIVGSVKDNGKAVAGATVTAIHQPTGTKYVTSSRKDGRYNIPNAKIGGPYSVEVSYVGYKTEKQDNIYLSLGQEYKGDFSLIIESANLEAVTVKTIRQDKNFNNSHTGSIEIVGRKQFEELPTVSRSLNDFVKLTPSANGLSFGGTSPAYNYVTLDGANFTNSFGLGTVGGILGAQTGQTPISLDAIDQLQVSVSPFDVRNGSFAGSGINAVTRSGTNQVKASVYTYLKSPGIQGYNVDNVNIARQTYKYSLEGVSLGAPIIKNKLFIFVNFEKLRQTAPYSNYVGQTASVPAANGTVSQTDADTLAALRQFLVSKVGYDPGDFQNYSFNTQSDKLTTRLDWNINSSNTVTLKYNYFKSEADQQPSGSGPAASGYTSVSRGASYTFLPYKSVGYGINNNFNIFIAELNTKFSNTISNKFQIGYSAIRDPRSSPSSKVFPQVDILSLNPTIGSGGTSFGTEQFTYGNAINTNVFQFSDIVSIFAGAHDITLGTQNYFKKYEDYFAPQFAGLYQFATLQDFYNSVNNGTGSQFYTNEYSAVQGNSFPASKSGSNEWSVFAQDKYRLLNNFTLTYGIRFDERSFNGLFINNPNFGALSFNNQTYNTGLKPKSNLAVSPRVGFNWDIKQDKTLQVRGGIGIFNGAPPFVWLNNQSANNGMLFGQNVSSTLTGTGKVTPTGGLPFNATVNTSAPSNIVSPTQYTVNITDPNFKYPSSLKGTLGLDKKLPGDVIVTVEANWTKDIQSVFFKNVNLNEVGGTQLAGADNRTRYAGTTTQTVNGVSGVSVAGNAYYPTLTNPITKASLNSATQPGLSSVILMTNSNKGYSYAYTARVQKTFKDLFTSIAYTYSEAKNTNELGTTAASLWGARPVIGDPNADVTGYASYWQPHRIIASASYKIPESKYSSASIGIIYEAAPAGVTSYIYNGDVNNDGNSGNDLVYIPKTANDINLVKVGSGANGTSTSTDPRTASQIWAQLNNYISQDHYLAFHRGQYAQRNGVVLPWFKRADLNITQDFYIYSGKNKDKHTLRFTLDVLNLGNFLNRNWGIYKLPTLPTSNGNIQLLKFEGISASGKPSYSFLYYDSGNQIPATSSFTNNTATSSRWQMQFGIRYLFN